MPPIYEHECPVCKDRVEVTRSIANRDEMVTCVFDDAPMTRLITTGAFHLQGDGWHKVEYNKVRRRDGK